MEEQCAVPQAHPGSHPTDGMEGTVKSVRRSSNRKVREQNQGIPGRTGHKVLMADIRNDVHDRFCPVASLADRSGMDTPGAHSDVSDKNEKNSVIRRDFAADFASRLQCLGVGGFGTELVSTHPKESR